MPSNREQQFTILPEERYVPTLQQIPLSRIIGDSLQPSERFVESIRSLGLIQPIAVVDDGDGDFSLVAGRRRVGALRQIALERDANEAPDESDLVPALVYPHGTPRHVASAMSISENVQRSANPLTDLQAIESMVRAGASEQDIADQLHLPIGTIRSRMRLASLRPALRSALEQGTMAPSTAERAAGLDSTRQRELERVLTRDGRITAADVSELLRVRTDQMAAELPDSIFHAVGEGSTEELRAGESDNIGVAAVPGIIPLPTLDESGLPSEQSWNGVLRALERAEQLLPMPQDGSDEEIASFVADILAMVREKAAGVANAA